MKAGRAQCPACFFVFSPVRHLFSSREGLSSLPSPPLFRAVHTKTFSSHVRAQIATVVRKTGLSTHARSTRTDMGPRSRGALLLADVDPVEGLEPGEPASPYTWGVAVGVAQELLDAVTDLA